MATFYLDYEGGNDANDGLSFANRWKTVNNGATAARIAPGDTIRIMASPTPTSLGINATWTDLSPTVTLASALNTLVTNCDTAWTASPNVTATANTTTYRTSTGSASMAFAGAFTTGLAAYFGLGSAQDYSAFQGLTFWIQTNTAIAASTLSLRLCSDTVGAVTVDTIAIPPLPVANAWVPVYVDKAAALGASIQSIALYADLDPGTATVLIDNISVVKAAGADNLNLTSLIGKNTAGEHWWAIRSINETTVTLDNAPGGSSAGVPKGYVGTTGSVLTYKRETIKTTMVSTSTQPIQDSGTSGNLITFSGGWNRTDMSTQDGDTYFDGQSGTGSGLDYNLQTFVHVDRWFSVRYATGLLCGPADCSFGSGGAIASTTVGLSVGTAASRFRATSVLVTQGASTGCSLTGPAFVCGTLDVLGVGDGSVTAAVVYGRGIKITTFRIKNSSSVAMTLGQFATNNVDIGTLEITNATTGLNQLSVVQDLRVKTMTLSAITGVAFTCFGGNNYRVDALTVTNCGTALTMGTGFVATDAVIGNMTTSGNTTVISATGFIGVLRILTSSFAEGSPLSFSGSEYTSGRVVFQHYDGTSNDHRTYYGTGTNGATVFSDSTTRHVDNGLSWKFTVQNATFVNADFPVIFPVARIAVKAGTEYMAAIWTRRSNVSAVGTFRCRGGQLAGIPNDVTSSSVAAVDTWEQKVITFTPTIDGVIDLEFSMYGPALADVYIHDFTVS